MLPLQPDLPLTLGDEWQVLPDPLYVQPNVSTGALAAGGRTADRETAQNFPPGRDLWLGDWQLLHTWPGSRGSWPLWQPYAGRATLPLALNGPRPPFSNRTASQMDVTRSPCAAGKT